MSIETKSYRYPTCFTYGWQSPQRLLHLVQFYSLCILYYHIILDSFRHIQLIFLYLLALLQSILKENSSEYVTNLVKWHHLHNGNKTQPLSELKVRILMASEHFHDLAPTYLSSIPAILLTILFNLLNLPPVLDHIQLILSLNFSLLFGTPQDLLHSNFISLKKTSLSI